MAKNFLSFDDQIRHLNEDKKIICEGPDDKEIIIRVGYFNLVNGYKTPFTSSKDGNGNHIYSKGTTIRELYELKKFDDTLRYHLLYYITRVEEEIRTIFSYLFDKENLASGTNWKDEQSYLATADSESVRAAISKIELDLEIRKSTLQYVRFYYQNHTPIPTWVATKAIDFGTFINFVKLSKTNTKLVFCKLYGMMKNQHYDETLMIGSFHWMRVIRNSCAHNERIYCISGQGRTVDSFIKKLGKRYSSQRDRRIFDLLVYMKYYLSTSDYSALVGKIRAMLLNLQSRVSEFAFANIRGSMGIRQFQDLDFLIKEEIAPKIYLEL